LAHSGEWLFKSGPEGTLVTARHTVALDPAALESVFGPGTTIAQALLKARDIIGANSRGTLRTARSHLGQGAAE
jgi:aromatase